MSTISNNIETNISLWKYFTDDAAKIKDRMWTISSWMFTLLAALLAYIGRHLETTDTGIVTIENELLVTISAVMGIVLSIYTMFMIQQYGQHIRGMWNRADLSGGKFPD